MNLKIIYYENKQQIKDFIEKEKKEKFFIADIDNIHKKCNNLIHIESDKYETIFENLFSSIIKHNKYQKIMIFEHIFSHYVRVMRYIKSIEDCSFDVVCFIDKIKINVFDLSFCFYYDVDYYIINDDNIIKYDLDNLVEFYKYDVIDEKILQTADKDDTNAITKFKRYFSKEDKNILFLAADNEYNLYLKPYLPIFVELKKQNVNFKIITFNQSAKNFLDIHNIEHILFDNLTTIQNSNNDLKDFFIKEIYIKDEKDILDFMINLSLNSANLPNVVKSYKKFKEIGFDKYSDIFYIPDGSPHAFYASLFINKQETYCIIAAGLSRKFSTLVYYMAKNIFCQGLKCKEAISSVFKDKNIILSGDATLYRYNSYKKKSNKIFNILIATSRYDYNEIVWIQEVLKSFKDDKKVKIYLKAHPFYKHIYNELEMGNHILIDNDSSIDEYIVNSNLIITDHSQVGKDAHLLGKPVISMVLNDTAPYLKDIKSISYCKSIDCLIKEIDKFIHNPNITIDQDFIKDFNYGDTTIAYKRILRVLGAYNE